MSIPTSLIVVLLVVAWLVVLVPMVAKRRDKVPRTQSGGNGFRVLRRAQATLKRRPQRKAKASSVEPDESPTPNRERTLVTVGAPDEQPRDAAEEWASVNAGYRTAPGPEAPAPDDTVAFERAADAAPEYASPEYPAPEYAGEPAGDQAQGTLWADGPDEPMTGSARESVTTPVRESVTAFPRDPRIPAEVDEQEWAEHAAAASAPIAGRRADGHQAGNQVDDEALRPTPRRRGRGGYDPEAAEATRAYKYRQRRRVTLVLAAATVVFILAAFLLVGWLWVGAALSFLLLVLYLTYLRRQVRIEAQIRQRRMERLQRARQIRPEYGRGRPPARAGRSAAGPGRTVVDLDDDDPGFDHLEPYEPPMTYRRAAGQ